MLVQDVAEPLSAISTGREPRESGDRGRHSWQRFVLVFGSYCFIALIPICPALIHGPARALQAAGAGDPSQEVWFVEFIPWAILHGHSPFITDWINAPNGANLLENTSLILPALIATPVTLIFGAIAGFNFIMVLSFALSACAMYFAVSHWVSWRPAAYFAGLLYGFSPFMVGQGLGHVFLLFAPVPPLILYVLYRGLIASNDRPRLWGIWLGILLAAQFFISTEVLASLGVVGAVAGVFGAYVYRQNLRELARKALPVAAYALAVFAVVCGIPVILLFFGADHYSGPAQDVTGLGLIRTDLLSPVVPNGMQLIRPLFIGPPFGDFAEADLYLGIPLVAFLVYAFVKLWKRRGIRLLALAAVAAWILSLGPRLRVDHYGTSIPLPFTVLDHLPVTQSLVPARVANYVYLFCAPVFAIGLDRLRNRILDRSVPAMGSLVAVLVTIVALIPLIPSWPYASGTLYVPAFITSKAELRIPPGSTVVTYPFPDNPSTPMSWQALDAMRYKLVGGEVISPEPDGRATFYGTYSDVTAVSLLAYTGGKLPPMNSPFIRDVRLDLQVYDAGTVIVAPIGREWPWIVKMYEAALGVAPQHTGGAYVWFHAYESLIATLERPGS
jgi:hypothetical protein